MRKYFLAVLSVLLVFSFSTIAMAVPYTGADIELYGNQYDANLTTGTWMSGTEYGSVYTAWAWQSIAYTTSLDVGKWNVGINVTNFGDLGDGWYVEFRVVADSDGNATVLRITASSEEVNNGYFTEFISEYTQTYTVTYTWYNDKYDPDEGLDANIQINSAFFDDLSTPGGSDGAAPVPEPATMLLLGTGLLGLAVGSRKKFFKK